MSDAAARSPSAPNLHEAATAHASLPTVGRSNMAGLYPAHRKWGPETEGKTPYEMYREVDFQTKEYLIAVEEVKLMQEQLKVCYLKSGPNHFEDCKSLREKLWVKMNTYNYGAPGPARSVRTHASTRRSPHPAARMLSRPAPPPRPQTSKYGIINPMGDGNVRPAPEPAE